MSGLLTVFKENNDSSPNPTSALGRLGEEAALRLLIDEGFTPVVANFKVPVGRNSRGAQVTGEIDLIAIEGGTLCFVEVKTRTTDHFRSPESAVDLRKQRQITRTARIYRNIFGLQSMPYRYDVISVVAAPGSDLKIELMRGFWTDGRFRKRLWNDGIYQNEFPSLRPPEWSAGIEF